MGGKQCSLYDVFYSVQIKQRFLKFLVSPFNVIFFNFQFYEIVIKMFDDFSVSVVIACLLIVFKRNFML